VPADAGWLLVVDADRQPQGWVHGSGDGPPVTATAEGVVPGGSLYDVSSGSLRSALDAALSSPSGQGVAVDAGGAVVGSVRADDVLRVLDDARRDESAA
jgi:osmoprotectant transport system ATP-binding protein